MYKDGRTRILSNSSEVEWGKLAGYAKDDARSGFAGV